MKRAIGIVSAILSIILMSVPASADPWGCDVHGFDYHNFNGRLIDYVGEGAFNKWFNTYESIPGENDCAYYLNLYRFIHHFDIPQAVFEDIIYTYGIFWNKDVPVEILYGADEQTADAYYRDHKSREDYTKKKYYFWEIRRELDDLARVTEAYRDFYDKYGNDKAYSVADFVRVTGIEKEELQALFESWRVVEYPDGNKVRNSFEWDFDLLYELAEEPEKATPLGKVNEDLLFCGQPVIEETVYTAPQTGDNTTTAAVVCILSGVLLLITIPAIRKRRK